MFFLFQAQPARLLIPRQVVVPTRVGQVYVYDTVRPEQEEYDIPPRHQPPGQQDIYDIPPSRQQNNTQVRLPTDSAFMTTVTGEGAGGVVDVWFGKYGSFVTFDRLFTSNFTLGLKKLPGAQVSPQVSPPA